MGGERKRLTPADDDVNDEWLPPVRDADKIHPQGHSLCVCVCVCMCVCVCVCVCVWRGRTVGQFHLHYNS